MAAQNYGLLNSAGIAVFVGRSAGFTPLVAQAVRRALPNLRLSFLSMPGSCRLAARVLDVMEKSSFIKGSIRLDVYSEHKLMGREGSGVQQNGFPFEGRDFGWQIGC